MFAIFDNVISVDECIFFKHRIKHWYFASHRDEFEINSSEDYQSRILDITPDENFSGTSGFIRDFNLDENTKKIQTKICSKIKQFLENKINVRLTLGYAELQCWSMNSYSSPHVHNIGDKGSCDYNSLLYLNDNFNGGEFFTENGILVRPKPGRLTFFDGSKIEHGLNTVYDDHRYTIIFWWKNTKFN